jgi:glycosyltransferase involved in cell wall biosynthesis
MITRRTTLLYIITKLELGGAQKQLLSLINNLDKEKFDISLFTAKDGMLMEDALSIRGIKVIRSRFLERPVNPFKDLLAFLEVYFYIRKNRIQFVHTHSSKAGIIGRLAASLAKVKITVHTVHGWSFNAYQHSLKQKFFIWLEKLSADFTDKIVVLSEYDKNLGMEKRIGQEHKYRVIRCGIDYAEFAVRDKVIRRELAIADNELLVGMVSCFKPQKSPLDFVKLAALVNRSMPGTRFLLVGDGVLRDDVQDLIRSLGLEQAFILTGWRRDIPRIMSCLDVFVLTSLWEGLPVTVLESIAASVPVVATDTGGIHEVISDGETGFLVAPQDLNGLSEKLLLLLKDKDLRLRIAERAKGSLGFYSGTKDMAANTQDLYGHLIRSKLN